MRIDDRLRADLAARHKLPPGVHAAVVAGDCVAGDAVNPGANRARALELRGVAVDTQHDFLEDVLGDLERSNAPPDEGEQPTMEFTPDRLAVGRDRPLVRRQHP